MKNPLTVLIAVISVITISCNREKNTAAPEPFLSEITELRYLPDDSVTTHQQLDRDGVIVLEKSSKYGARRGYKDSEQLNKIEESLKYCRIFTYNAAKQLIKITNVNEVSRKLPASVDTLIFQNGRVVRRELKDYLLHASLGTFTFPYPLWQTKSIFDYDANNRVSTETDSVFIGHDIPIKSSVLEKINFKFAYKVLTKNEYNDKGELIKKTTESFKTNNVIYTNGNGAMDDTKAGKIISGTTIYNYQYDSKNQLISKLAKFTDSKTNQVYNSVFIYSYNN